MKPTYFDFTVHDVDQARKFFQAVFNWKFERFPASDGMPPAQSPAVFVSE